METRAVVIEEYGHDLQANAFLMQKAGVFAESWRRALVENPQFDWTAVRPAVNVVQTINHANVMADS